MSGSRGVLLCFLSVTATALSYPLLKFALLELSFTQALLVESLFTLALCALYARVKGGTPLLAWQPLPLAIGGIVTLATLCHYASLNLLSPVMVGLLGRLYLLFAVLFGVYFFKETLSAFQGLLVALGLAGSFLFAYQGADFSSLAGLLFALAYTFLFALSNVLAKVYVRSYDTNALLFTSKVITLVVLGSYSLLADGSALLQLSPSGIGFVMVASLFHPFIGILLFYEAMKSLPFNLANMIRSTSPILVALYSWPFFPIELTPMKLLGALMILGSVFWLLYLDMRKAAAPPLAVPKPS